MRGSSARPSNATGRTKKPLNRSSTSSLNGSYLVMLAMIELLSKSDAVKMGAEKKVSSPPPHVRGFPLPDRGPAHLPAALCEPAAAQYGGSRRRRAGNPACG